MRPWYTSVDHVSMSIHAPGLRIVLASTSPWRRALCAQVGLDVEARAPLVDEASIQGDDPVELSRARAVAKAESLAAADALVLGSDQVCHLDGIVYGKPRDPAHHLAQLQALRGRSHTLSDGVCLVGPGVHRVFVVEARVTLRADVSDAELAAYVASGDASGCAGGYRCEGPGAWLIEAIAGDWFTVVGLPVYRVLSELRALGWTPEAVRHRSGTLPQGSSA